MQSESDSGDLKRQARWDLLHLLWDVSELPRVRACGRIPARPGNDVGVRRSYDGDGRTKVGFAGLGACGSVWCCPRCSARILAVRRLELGVLVAAASAAGYSVAFGTVTLRHKQGQSLASLWKAVSEGSRAVAQSKRVRQLRSELHKIGYVRTLEVTHGRNGWHPHIHTLQLFRGEVTQEQLDVLADAEFAVWKQQATKRRLGAPIRKCYRLDLVADAAESVVDDYMTKAGYYQSDDEAEAVAEAAESFSFEMTTGMQKIGRKIGSRTPWQIVSDFKKTGDMDDLDLWHEFEAASKGKRMIVWSPGLRKMFDVEESSDEDIAAKDEGHQEDTLFYVTDWSPIARAGYLGGQLLTAVRRGGLDAGLQFCRRHGIPTRVGRAADD